MHLQFKLGLISWRRSFAVTSLSICGVVERPVKHCGDDLVKHLGGLIMKLVHLINMIVYVSGTRLFGVLGSSQTTDLLSFLPQLVNCQHRIAVFNPHPPLT